MKYIAHRGKTIHALENTKEAFLDAAKDSHYDGIECDIYTSRDGEFFVFHDESTKRLSREKHLVMDLTFDELKQIKLTDKLSNFYEIPHIIEFLDICKTYQKQPVIEIKKLHDITNLHNFLALLDDYRGLNPIVISFNIDYLKYLRAISNIELYLLTNDINDQLIYDCRVNELNFNIDKKIINKEIVTKLKKKGFKVAVFTVNSKKQENEFKNLKIDLLTTDKL